MNGDDGDEDYKLGMIEEESQHSTHRRVKNEDKKIKAKAASPPQKK
jgi:hypothetical protein